MSDVWILSASFTCLLIMALAVGFVVGWCIRDVRGQ